MKFLLLSVMASCLVACAGGVAVRDLRAMPDAFLAQQTFTVEAVRPDAIVVVFAPGSEEPRLNAAIEDSLTRKGYRLTTDQPDMRVQYTVYLRDRYTLSRIDDYRDHTWLRINPDRLTSLSSELSGYLQMRVVDADSGEVLWSGVAERVANLQDRNGRLLEGVDLLLADVPVRR